MDRKLPLRPSLTQLKNQAKDLLKGFRSGDANSISRFGEKHPRSSDRLRPLLTDAQLVIAREYGFSSWPKIKRHVESLEEFEARVARVRNDFSRGDLESRKRLLKPAHAKERFENYDPNAERLSEADARLLIANEEGYAFWSKYESFLHLDPAVRDVIVAVRTGELARLHAILQAEPSAANPKWVSGFRIPEPIPNDSIPLFCVSEAVFRKTNQRGNEYEITQALLNAGADIEITGGQTLTGAVSFDAINVVESLLDGGALVDGVDGDGTPMAYAMHFGHVRTAELLARRGAKLDLRFAAGVGRLDVMKGFFNSDGTLKPGAGALADPYGFEHKARGKSAFRCERTRPNILSQALYFACRHHRLEAVKFLLSQGADINAMVPGLDARATILHWMASSSHAEGGLAVISFLLDHGANPNIRDEYHNETPLGWARYCKREDVVDLLMSYRE
jgi:ankyrin repeat protein